MILITGSTGNIGRELLPLVPEARPLIRDPAQAPFGTRPMVGDLTRPGEIDFTGVHRLFLMPGYPGVVEAAAAAGVERVVLLSGSSAEGGDLDNAVSRYMIETERAVRASGLVWTILRPSAFMSNALRWLPQLAAGDTVRAQFPHVAAAVIDPYDIASVAAIALTEDGHAGAIHRITGPEPLTPADQVRILAEATGRDLTFVGLSNEETRAELERTMPPQYVAAFWNFYVDGALDESVVTGTVADVAGRPPRTFAQWAAGHIEMFR